MRRRSTGSRASSATRPMLDGVPRRFGASALRVFVVLAIIAMTLWTGAVGCLWVNETRLVFSANRSRVISPVDYDDLLQLTTPDGVGIDAVSLPAGAPSDYWIL